MFAWTRNSTRFVLAGLSRMTASSTPGTGKGGRGSDAQTPALATWSGLAGPRRREGGLEVELMTFRAYHAARRKNEPADEGCFRTNTFGGPHDPGQYGQHRSGRHDIP